MEWVSSRTLFVPSGKRQEQHLLSILVLILWQLHKYYWNSCLAQLHPRERGWTNSLPLFNDWDDAGPPPSTTLNHLGHLFAGIAMSSWRSTERHEDFFSESVVSHLVLWVSSCGVLVLFLVGFVLFWFWKTPGFLLSPILQYVGIANQRQNVLMTVRASSVHGMSPKKKRSTDLQLLESR